MLFCWIAGDSLKWSIENFSAIEQIVCAEFSSSFQYSVPKKTMSKSLRIGNNSPEICTQMKLVNDALKGMKIFSIWYRCRKPMKSYK